VKIYDSNQPEITMVVNSRGRKNNIKAKKHYTESSLSVNPKEFMAQCVKHIAQKIMDAKEDVDKCTLRGLAEKLLQEGKKHFPSMSMNVINYARKKMKNTMLGKPKLKNSSKLLGPATCISSLAGGSNKKSDAAQTNHKHQASNPCFGRSHLMTT
jgi:hypothetical protein